MRLFHVSNVILVESSSVLNAPALQNTLMKTDKKNIQPVEHGSLLVGSSDTDIPQENKVIIYYFVLPSSFWNCARHSCIHSIHFICSFSQVATSYNNDHTPVNIDNTLISDSHIQGKVSYFHYITVVFDV